jgi:hypothetical protein
MWQRRQPQDKEVLLAVALSQPRARQRRLFAKRRQNHNGRDYRYRLCDAAGTELGELSSTELLEPGDLIRAPDVGARRVVAIAPLQDEARHYVALVDEV